MKKVISKNLVSKKQVIAVFILVALFGVFIGAFACGGGVIPYVPTQTGAGGASNSNTGQFHIIEKGVAVSMFDVKRLQPLFRNIILSGNERKKTKASSSRKNKKAATAVAEAKPDSSFTNLHGSADHSENPVLNIHRLH